MGKVELELMEWRTEGPDKQVSATPLRALTFSSEFRGGGGGDTVSVGPEGS